MPNTIDLHIHTIASDGTDNPVQLAEKVKSAGISVFAITDHDTITGAEQLKAQMPDDMFFIPGIEFSCRMASGKCHILGYDCNMTHPAFQSVLCQGAKLRRNKKEQIIYLHSNKGIRFPEDELEKLYQLSSVGKPHLGNLMVKYGYAPDRKTAIEQTINLCFTESSRIQAEIAVKAILASGGIPVWAHPLGGEGEKQVTPEQFSAMLDELTGFGLMGLECFYSKYPLAYCEKLAKFAQAHSLLISGGSDYHGANKSVALGTLNADNQPVSEEQLTILNVLLGIIE